MARRWNPFQRNRAVLTAAFGDTIVGTNPASAKNIAKRSEKWQELVLQLASAVPEASGAAGLVRNSLDLVELKVESENEDFSAELEASLKDFPMGRAGQLIWLAGEAWPAWASDGEQVYWDVFAPTEVLAESGRIAKVKDQRGKFVPLDPGMQLYRTWQQAPENRYAAWSANKSQIDLLRAMYLHQLADTSVATSRLAGAGILYWPTNLPSFPLKNGRPEEGSREELQMNLHYAMTQSIEHRDSDNAVVPLVVFGDPSVDENQAPQHILLERPDDAKGYSERMEAYAARYARGVELPVESVTGIGPANHWTAFVVKEDKWRFYINPLADIITKSLTENYAKSVAEHAGYDGPVNIVADGSKLVAKPDKADKAILLAQIGGYLNRNAVLEATGFDPEKDAADGSEPVPEAQLRVPKMPAEMRDTSPV